MTGLLGFSVSPVFRSGSVKDRQILRTSDQSVCRSQKLFSARIMSLLFLKRLSNVVLVGKPALPRAYSFNSAVVGNLQVTSRRCELFQKKILFIGNVERVWLEPCLSKSITPFRPINAAPLRRGNTGLPVEFLLPGWCTTILVREAFDFLD